MNAFIAIFQTNSTGQTFNLKIKHVTIITSVSLYNNPTVTTTVTTHTQYRINMTMATPIVTLRVDEQINGNGNLCYVIAIGFLIDKDNRRHAGIFVYGPLCVMCTRACVCGF